MKPIKLLSLCLGATLVTACCTMSPGNHPRWQSLLGPDVTKHWRAFGGKGFPQTGWSLEAGVLHLQPGGKGGDLISVTTFEDFELEWEWKLAPKANNGLKYLVTEARPRTPGHEYQMVDDSTMPNPKHQTASFYDVLPVQEPAPVKSPGEWNRSRIIVRGPVVEHWLNGKRVLRYRLDSEETKAALAQSKFKNAPGFGDKIKGHILLTNHNDETWYRHIRIRELRRP